MATSRVAIYGAIGANVAIATLKFVVAGITGSSAMLSEGVHSVVDTGNGLLLLVGIKLSQKKPSAEHPFGHGKEIYFWSLIVAVLIFGVGGGVSAYEGILHIMHPKPLQNASWSYLVLASAALFEGASFVVALRQFMRQRTDPKLPFWRALRISKDPTTHTVIAEDGAALMGLAAAAIGIFISDRFDLPSADGGASIFIGVLLAAVAIVLIRKARGLLIGEGIRPETASAIRELALSTPGIRTVARPLSMYIGPEEILLTLDVGFDPEFSADDVAAAVRRLENAIRERYPRMKRIYIEARSPNEAAQMTS
jgi:cation diffusion facilitator family transporter